MNKTYKIQLPQNKEAAERVAEQIREIFKNSKAE